MRLIFFTLLILSSVAHGKDNKKVILILGDSITEGYGIAKEQSYPSLLQKKLKEKNVKIINSGISGSTTASAYSRIKWVLKRRLDVVMIALGGNDGLRGTKPSATKANLEKAIKLAQKNNVKVILAGMMLPYNYGEDYRTEFSKVFSTLAKKYKLDYIPFLLKDVGGKKELNLADGIHPNEEGHKVISSTVLPYMEKHL